VLVSITLFLETFDVLIRNDLQWNFSQIRWSKWYPVSSKLFSILIFAERNLWPVITLMWIMKINGKAKLVTKLFSTKHATWLIVDYASHKPAYLPSWKDLGISAKTLLPFKKNNLQPRYIVQDSITTGAEAGYGGKCKNVHHEKSKDLQTCHNISYMLKNYDDYLVK